MDHYLEIRVLPDPEFSSEMLMAALFAKLHRVLGARGQGDIGVSFPDVMLCLERVYACMVAPRHCRRLKPQRGVKD